MNEPDRFRPWRLTLIFVLALAALSYELKGFSAFISGNPQDLHTFWIWEKYLLERQYPPDVVCAHGELFGATPIHTGRREAIDPALGPALPAAYPPPTFVTFLLWTLPGWRATCLLVGAWNLVMLAVAMFWAYRIGARFGREQGWLMAVTVAAVSSICTLLRNGQVGMLSVGFLAAALLCEEENRPIAAGFLLGLSALKPTIAGPFFFIFLVRRQWLVLFSAAMYMAVAIVALWAVTGAPPWDMYKEMIYAPKIAGLEGYGPEDWLKSAGVNYSMAEWIPGAVGVIAGLAIAYTYRRIPILPLTGMMSVIARLWAYHRMYDNVTLIFLLVALGERMLRRKDGFSVAMFLIIGISLWFPAAATVYEAFRAYQMLAWVGGLAALCIMWRHEKATPTDAIVAPIQAAPLMQ